MKKRTKINVGAELIAGMDNAIAYARGLKSAKRATIAHVEVPDKIDVRRIRTALGMSQAAFAARFGFGIKNVCRIGNRVSDNPKCLRTPICWSSRAIRAPSSAP